MRAFQRTSNPDRTTDPSFFSDKSYYLLPFLLEDAEVPRKEPLFLLDLLIKDGVIVTSIDLDEDCRQMVLRLFNQALRTIHDTPQIETLVMEHFYSRGGDVPNIKVVHR